MFALAEYLFSLEPPPNPNAGTRARRRTRGLSSAKAARPVTRRRSTPTTSSRWRRAIAAARSSESRRRDAAVGGNRSEPRAQDAEGHGLLQGASLKGVWYRGMFNHDGSVTTLEEWFDPARLRDDFVPSGSKATR